MRHLIVAFTLITISFSAEAEIVSEDMRRQISFGFRWIQESGQDYKRVERSAYKLQLSEPVWERLRIEGGLFFAEDGQRLPRHVRVRDDWLGLFAGAEWSHPWLFRWFASTGLVAQYERTSIRYTGEPVQASRTESRRQVYPYLRVGIDYAINSEYELSLELGNQRRAGYQQLDWFWGISFGYNLP